jgi:sugar O-acyltransferase (sialic acid O-acetyltransferase NeuD family)
MTSLPVIIIGVNPFGLEVAHIFQKNDVVVYGFLDDDPKKKDTSIGEIPVLGTADDESYFKLIGKNCGVFVALENPTERKKMIELILDEREVKPVNAIHPSANIADVKSLAYGVFIGSGAQILPETKLGDHVIIGSGAIVETGAQIADFASIGAGSVIGKEAIIENNAYVGIHSTIVGSVKVGKSATVGAGSVVIENVGASKRVFGNPAKAL